MRETKAVKAARLFERLTALGLTYSEADKLRRIEMTLSRWDALRCGDGNSFASWYVEEDETSGHAYMVTQPHDGKSSRRRIPNREAGALRRAAAIMSGHPDLWMYHQTDPRGCSLYVGRKSDVNGHDLNTVYNNGVAVCL